MPASLVRSGLGLRLWSGGLWSGGTQPGPVGVRARATALARARAKARARVSLRVRARVSQGQVRDFTHRVRGAPRGWSRPARCLSPPALLWRVGWCPADCPRRRAGWRRVGCRLESQGQQSERRWAGNRAPQRPLLGTHSHAAGLGLGSLDRVWPGSLDRFEGIPSGPEETTQTGCPWSRPRVSLSIYLAVTARVRASVRSSPERITSEGRARARARPPSPQALRALPRP